MFHEEMANKDNLSVAVYDNPQLRLGSLLRQGETLPLAQGQRKWPTQCRSSFIYLCNHNTYVTKRTDISIDEM